MNKRIKVLVSAVLAAVMLVLCIPFTAAAAGESKAIIANQGTLSGKTITWTSDNFTLLVEQGSNTNAIRTSDSDHFRIYQGNKVTITAQNDKTISSIVFTTTGSSYTTPLKNSVPSSATATVNGNNVTFTFATPVSVVEFSTTAQVRINKIEVVFAGASSGSGSDNDNDNDDDTPTFVKPTTPEAIVNALYALESGETLAEGPYTLEGVIKSIDTGYSDQFKNITVTIIVGDMTDKPVVCYRLKGDDAATIAEGDTIKVTGELTNYSGTYEFTSGCTFELVKKAEKPFEKPTEPKDIVDALYALGKDETLPGGNYTLTGKITSIDDAYSEQYKNITVTIVVGDMTDKPVICFRLKGDGADALKVGDTITVTGTLCDYDGKKEFNSGCTFVLANTGSEVPPAGDEDDDEDDGGETTTPATCPLEAGKGYTISASNANGKLYATGGVTGGRFDGTLDADDAAVFFIEAGANAGEYLLYFMNGETKTYIVIEDESTGGSTTTDKAAATVFEWNADKNTLVVADDSNNRAFGAGATSTYNNFSCYDVSGSYNWGAFTAVATSEGGNTGSNPETGDSVVAYIAVAVVALFGIAYVSKKH